MPFAIRTCDKNLKSYNGFQWVKKGYIEAPDWEANSYCGNGLHGFLNGQGDGSLADWSSEAIWLLLEIPDNYIALNGKVKFPHCKVLKVGKREEIIKALKKKVPNLNNIIGDIVTGGHYSTVTGGHGSTVTGGHRSTVTGGHYSTVTGGDGSTVTGGDNSILSIKYYDESRYRLNTVYVGENGIQPNVLYKLNDKFQFIKA